MPDATGRSGVGEKPGVGRPDVPDLEFERELPFSQGFTLRELDPAFERIALCQGTQSVEVRAVSDARLLATLLPRALSADGRFLVVSVDARRLQVWNLEQLRNQFRALGVDWEESQHTASSVSR